MFVNFTMSNIEYVDDGGVWLLAKERKNVVGNSAFCTTGLVYKFIDFSRQLLVYCFENICPIKTHFLNFISDLNLWF